MSEISKREMELEGIIIKMQGELGDVETENRNLKAALAAKDAELDTCQRMYSEQRDRKNMYAEELAKARELADEWEKEGAYLDNPGDDVADRTAGRAYKECAKALREALTCQP